MGTGRDSCLPQWARDGDECPYGQKAPLVAITIPKELDALKILALCYSFVPHVVICILLARLVLVRSSREICWVAFCVVLGVTCDGLQRLFPQERPRSCAHSCGFPPYHVALIVATSLLLFWVHAVQRSDALHWRVIRGAAAIGLLPQLWARVELGDVSWLQVCFASALGVVWVVLWIACIGYLAEKALVRYVFGGILSADVEGSNIELAALTPRSRAVVMSSVPTITEEEDDDDDNDKDASAKLEEDKAPQLAKPAKVLRLISQPEVVPLHEPLLDVAPLHTSEDGQAFLDPEAKDRLRGDEVVASPEPRDGQDSTLELDKEPSALPPSDAKDGERAANNKPSAISAREEGSAADEDGSSTSENFQIRPPLSTQGQDLR